MLHDLARLEVRQQDPTIRLDKVWRDPSKLYRRAKDPLLDDADRRFGRSLTLLFAGDATAATSMERAHQAGSTRAERWLVELGKPAKSLCVRPAKPAGRRPIKALAAQQLEIASRIATAANFEAAFAQTDWDTAIQLMTTQDVGIWPEIASGIIATGTATQASAVWPALSSRVRNVNRGLPWRARCALGCIAAHAGDVNAARDLLAPDHYLAELLTLMREGAQWVRECELLQTIISEQTNSHFRAAVR